MAYLGFTTTATLPRTRYLGSLPTNGAPDFLSDGSTVISANSTYDGLRITQTGAGNALVVEDSANPDASPFVVNSDGSVIVGSSTPVNNVNVANGVEGVARFQLAETNSLGSTIGSTIYATSFTALAAPTISLGRSNTTTVGGDGIVSSGDLLGTIQWHGNDGTAQVRSAFIQAYVDGTPGTGDMPGRLVFSTTADGASSPTERMRITNAGSVGIGTSSLTGVNLGVAKNITGNTVGIGVTSAGVIQSDVTGQARYYNTFASTQAASFTLNNLWHYAATQSTFGAGSTVGTQIGFFAENSLIGGTNNYGFYGNIPSGTGRWNFYANGTADNYFGGNVGIGTTAPSALLNVVANTSTDAVRITQTGASNALVVEDSTNPDATPFVVDGDGKTFIGSATNPYAGQFSVFNSGAYLRSFRADQFSNSQLFLIKSRSTTVGVAGSVASGDFLGVINFQGDDGTTFITAAQIGALVDGTPGTNDMPGRLVFSTTADGASTPTERMRIDNQGNVGVGTSSPSFKFHVNGGSAAVVNSGVDTSFFVGEGLGASQYGVLRWDAANNLFKVMADGTGQITFETNNIERMRIDSAGRVGIGATPSAGNNLLISSNITGATLSAAVNVNSAVQSGVTARASYYQSDAGTAAASFTLNSLIHYFANQAIFGAGSTVSNQYGFVAQSNLVGATNNYGFYGNIPDGSGRWNFYAAGTAPNLFSGNVTIFGAGGLGYSTGSGGAVTQTTSRTTGVTLDKTNGAITLVSAAGSATYQTFTVTNNTVAATDTIIINQKSGTDKYIIMVTNVSAGSFQVTFATTGGTTTEQPVFNFAVIKAVTA